jgi:hypothetical protein
MSLIVGATAYVSRLVPLQDGVSFLSAMTFQQEHIQFKAITTPMLFAVSHATDIKTLKFKFLKF